MSRLVAMLLQAGALSPERAKEARGHQVVFGDRIGTNLLALGFINELTLVQALGALHQMPFAAGRDADTKPALTRALPRQIAARLSAVPARADDDVVHVFVMDPLPPPALQELQAHFKRRVVPVLIAEARMWALLHKFYLVKRGMRAIRLDDETDTKRTAIKPRSAERNASSVSSAISLLETTNPGGMPPPVSHSGAGVAVTSIPSGAPVGMGSNPGAAPIMSSGTMPPAPAPAAARPVDTNWLASVLPSPSSSSTLPPATLPPAPAPPAAPTPPAVKAAPGSWLPVAARPDEQKRFDELVALEIPLTEEVLEEEVVGELMPEPGNAPAAAKSAVTSPTSLSSVPGKPVFAEADIPFDELVEDALVEEEAIVLGALVDNAPAKESSPLTFDSAKAALEGVGDRDAIARIVLRYAMSRVKRALLLTVQGSKGAEEAFGWDALGDGLRPGLIHDVRLGLQEPSALQLARESKAHVLGPLAKTTVNDELVSLLGGLPPKTAFVMPVLVRRRVVNLLYLDNGPGRFMVPDIGEVLILSQHINKSYETLLSKANN